MEPTPDASAPSPRIIKRYANRKLYDTRESRYVTLQQIAEFVRQGQDVHIVDNKTGSDITEVTLAQIIYEEQKNKPDAGAGSLGTLRGLIQRSGERLVETKRSVVAQSREALDELHRVADDRVRHLVGKAADQVQQLHSEIRRLQDRIEELEERLRRAASREASEADDEAKTTHPEG